MRALGDADLAAAQATDLGNLRPRAPDNAADHVRRDRGILRAKLPAIGRSRSLVVGAGVTAGGGATVVTMVDKMDIGKDSRDGGRSNRQQICERS